MIIANENIISDQRGQNSLVLDLLYTAKQNGIDITLKNEQLQVSIQENKDFDESIIQEIRNNKEAIVKFLGQKNWKSEKVGKHHNKIPLVDRDIIKNIPLSFSQERLWFIDQLEGSTQYHVPAVLHLNGQLDTEALSFAFKEIVSRHEVLRTVMNAVDGQPYQFVKVGDAWQLETVSDPELESNPKALQQYINNLVNKPFDLSKDFMIRATLIHLGKEDYTLVATLHHIASDGWSKSILVKEVAELYNSFTEKRKSRLKPLKIQYADFAYWQRTNLTGEVFDKKIAYWKNKLADVTSLQLPTDFKRPAVWKTNGATVDFKIDKELSTQLFEFSKREGATLFMSLLAAFKILLHRYSNQSDICIGTPIAGRQQVEVEELIGFFVNTLALRSEINGQRSFLDLLQQVKTTTLEAYANQEIPFEKIVNALDLQRDLSRNPLFQVMFILRNTPEIPELKIGEINLAGKKVEHTSTLFDITLFITENENGMSCAFEYSTSLYQESTIRRMVEHFKILLNAIVENPSQKIGLLPLLPAAEKDQLLVEFNDTRVPYPSDKSIIDLFEMQVAMGPDATAVVFEDQKISYRELNELSNQVAHYLQSKGVTSGMMLPICVKRSVEMIAGILGILKAGAAFVPVDPDYPIERITYMLQDSGSQLILTDSDSKTRLTHFENYEILLLDFKSAEIVQQRNTNLQTTISPRSLAYIIHTSGSTGMPKGVMIEHGSVVNLLKSVDDIVHFTNKSSFLSVTTFSFDICYLEFFTPLINGGRLIVVSREIAMDGFRLAQSIKYNRPTHMQATPATWQILLDAGWVNESRMKILIGGEAIKEEIKQALTKIGDVFNLYGPTETTIWSVCKKLETNQKVMIGKPIANTTIYILDNLLQPAPINVHGEIYIGGVGLAKGYLNRDDLTDERFIHNPFDDGKGSRLYKTGDVGRWLQDGNLECLGRVDDQVKIRGYRIELGEIETVLAKSNIVSQAVVIAKEDKYNTKRLISYYIPEWTAVKSIERELYKSQIESWKEIYEAEYSMEETVGDEEFDINIWKNSFTGEPIPENEMHEWLDDIINLILLQKPQNTLEIGSGSGLIYYQLAGKVKKYIATDFSRTSIEKIRRRIDKGLREYGPTELKVCAAHEVSIPEGEQVDTIIMNSIVQYFPGEEYMNTVIKNCMSILKGHGRIIIGDVRDMRLLGLFKARLQLQKLSHTVNLREFKWAVDAEVLKEEELCFSPEYFYRLKAIYPQISHVEIKGKEGLSTNELTLYRYNVILHVGESIEFLNPGWIPWNGIEGMRALATEIEAGKDLIALKNVPNFHLWREKLLTNAISERSVASIGELTQQLQQEEKEAVNIKKLFVFAREKGYRLRFLLNDDPLKSDVIMETSYSGRAVMQEQFEITADRESPVTNTPLFGSISSQLQKDIRIFLKQHVPDYMVPSELIPLKELPLTNNGKIDRKFLSEREEKAVQSKLNYQEPRNEIEQQLVNIWQELLGVSQVGINDNFFELGGHSLLAMRLVSLVRVHLGVEMQVKSLFSHPTIGELSKQLAGGNGQLLLPAINIEKRPEKIPLSFSQERLWFIDQMTGSTQYHIPGVFRLRGSLDKEALEQSFRYIVNRHEVLRTVYKQDEGEPVQYVKAKNNWQMNRADGAKYEEQQSDLKEDIQQLIKAPFDLSADDMLRATLITLGEEENVLVVTMHHIASDGWSMGVIVREITSLYESFSKGSEQSMPDLPIQYADYAIWQRNYLKEDLLERKLNYWKDKLHSVKALDLPTDKTRLSIQSSRGAVKKFVIDKELSTSIHKLNQQEGVTMFMTLLSCFKILLYRYTGHQDICVGSPIANRSHHELEGLIGFFVNTLALRDEVRAEDTFEKLLARVKTTTLEAYEHQDVPFERVVESVVKERDLSRSPLFQVMFVLQNTPEAEKVSLGDLELSTESLQSTTSKFEITFSIAERRGMLQGSIEYNVDLYNEERIDRMITHYVELLHSVVKSPSEKIAKLRMISADEERQLMVDFNNTAAQYPTNKSIVNLFEEQVKKVPGNTAVTYKERNITYNELNLRANKLANYLKERGVQAETLVPMFMERGIDMIISILGILKAGGVYVPIDPEYPHDRVRYMLEDCGAALVLTSKQSREKLPMPIDIEVLDQDELSAIINQEDSENLPLKPGPKQLCYIIYTSGSTGKPKGVMIEHRNVVRLFETDQPLFDFGEKDVWTMFHSYCFDFSVWEMYGALLYGGRLVIVPSEATKDTTLFAKILLKENVTILNQTPSAFYVLQDIITANTKDVPIRYVIFGGEALNPARLKPWKQLYHNSRLINMYGITETTVHVTYQEIGWEEIENGNSIIGKPIPTLTTYILDSSQNLQPVGIIGELCVGGAGLARGYLNRAELTAERFIKNPFGDSEEERLYRSGDLGIMLADGNLEYLGRMDDQVKIRGFRIELGEIETSIMQSGLVGQVVVLAQQNIDGTKRLVSYVVADQNFDKQAITAYLHSKLPDYMVPSLWVKLDVFPLTSNGKIDKKALPDPGKDHVLTNQYVAARNELEANLVDLWEELLHREHIGVMDNFFELGGHSLLVIRLVALTKRKLNLDITINDIFINPTIAGLADRFIEKVKNPSSQAANIKYLVPVKTAGTKVPIYIICGEGGTSLRFKKFAELMDADQPLYVLQPPVDLKELKDFPDTVEGIASLFIQEMMTSNPNGPYSLSGHCLGGFIAFEMAKQLKASGKTVNSLALFDTVLSETVKKDSPGLKNLFYVPVIVKRFFSKILLKINFEYFLLSRHTKHAIRYKTNSFKFLLFKLKNRKRLKSEDFEFVGLEIFNKPTIYSVACKNYELTNYDDELILFYAKERYYFTDNEKKVVFKKIHLNDRRKNLWSKFAKNIKIHEIGGDHSTMFEAENAEEFAQLIQEYSNSKKVS